VNLNRVYPKYPAPMLKKCVSVVYELLGKNSYQWWMFEYGLTYFRAHSLESLVEDITGF
jgi:hypothetical protein